MTSPILHLFAVAGAIAAVWEESGLDDVFKSYWTPSDDNDDFLVLNDSEADPDTPFPYAVYELMPSNVDVRMSGVGYGVGVNEIHSCQLKINIHTNDTQDLSAKTIAANLGSEVMKVFGGHPQIRPRGLSMANGGEVNKRYEQSILQRPASDACTLSLMYRIQYDQGTVE